jgi:ABC-type phosphate transport system substrate-binding protein
MPALAAVFVAVVFAAPAPAAAPGSGYRVIVHPSNPGNHVTKEVLAGIFRGRNSRWGDGTPIVPVDQSIQSAVRARLVKDVMNETVAAVMAYWARQVTAGGARPPVVKSSDREVIDFVARTAGSIGYVSPEPALPDTVKLLRVE